MEAEAQKRKDKETLDRIRNDLHTITLLTSVLHAAIMGLSKVVKNELETTTRQKLNELISLYFVALAKPFVTKLMPDLQDSFFVLLTTVKFSIEFCACFIWIFTPGFAVLDSVV